jgi:hypothetical protein
MVVKVLLLLQPLKSGKKKFLKKIKKICKKV